MLSSERKSKMHPWNVGGRRTWKYKGNNFNTLVEADHRDSKWVRCYVKTVSTEYSFKD